MSRDWPPLSVSPRSPWRARRLTRALRRTSKSKMAADDSVKALEINVDTKNGIVTLTGDVDSAIAKGGQFRSPAPRTASAKSLTTLP